MVLLAALALAAQDDLPELLRRLGDDAPAVREEAATALRRRPLADLPALEKAYADADADGRDRLRRILPAIRCRLYATLADAVGADRDPKLKEAVAELLKPDAGAVLAVLQGRVGESADRIVAALVEVYREDEGVFRAALRQRPQAIPESALKRVAACLEADEVDVVRAALDRLSRLERVPAYVSARANELAASPDHPARLDALGHLAALGDERAVDVLLRKAEAADPETARVALQALRDYLARRPSLAARGRAAASRLSDPDPEHRRLAYEILALAPIRAEDLGRVKSGLADENPKVRWGALELAAAVGDEQVFDVAAALLQGEEHVKAIETLFRLSPLRAVERLDVLYRRDPDFTEAWLEHLRERENPALVEAIRRVVARSLREGPRDGFDRMLRTASSLNLYFDASELVRPASDPDAPTRWTAFERVATASSPVAVEVLRAGLRDPDASVRRTAVQAAGRAKAAACLDEVLGILATERDLRYVTLPALGQIGDRKALPALLDRLDEKEYGGAALEAVASLALPGDVEALLERARRINDAVRRAKVVGLAASLAPKERVAAWVEDRRLRTGALQDLAKAKAVDVAAAAEKYLDDSDPRTAEAAAKLVGEARRASAVPALLTLVLDKEVRWAAVEALSRMPKESVVPGLSPLLKNRDPGVRLGAATALEVLEADVLAEFVRELLGDDDADLIRIGVRTVRKRGIRERLEDVERLTARSDARVRREALETLAALDWEGSRVRLLKRLQEGEQGLLAEAGPIFAERGDGALLPLLLDGMGRADDAGYEALIVLNGYRRPEATARARELRFNSTGTVPGADAWRKARSLSESLKVPLEVELPRPPGPRASFETDFDRSPGLSRQGGGGGFYRSRFGGGGRWSVFHRILAGLGRDLVPVVEDDRIRLLPRARAVDFWRAWAAERK